MCHYTCRSEVFLHLHINKVKQSLLIIRWPIMTVFENLINLPQHLPVQYQTPFTPFYLTFAWLKSQ